MVILQLKLDAQTLKHHNMEHIDQIGIKAYVKALPIEKKSFCTVFFIQLHIIFKVLKYYTLCVPVFLKGLFVRKHPKDISDQVVLVTGGANGLGRALCFRFASEGCHVAVADVDYENAKIVAAELRRQNVKSKAYKCDVSDYNAVTELKQQIEDDLGVVDILVNNAGILALASLREGKHTDIERIVRVNVLSHLWTIRTFLPTMVERRHGHIVAICSITALRPTPRGITYSATKCAVRGTMIALQDELELDSMDKFIQTTTVYPWFMNTNKELIDNIVNKTPAIKSIEILTPEEVADATVKAVKLNREKLLVPEAVKKWAGQTIKPREYRKVERKIFLGDIPKYMEFDT